MQASCHIANVNIVLFLLVQLMLSLPVLHVVMFQTEGRFDHL